MKFIITHYHPMNRPRNSARLDALERDIRNGDYRSDVGHFIKFDSNGNLIDGQKRVYAHLNCQQPLKINVHFGLPPESILYIDRGQPRTIAANVTLSFNIGKQRQPTKDEFFTDRIRFAVATWCKHGLRWDEPGTPRNKLIWTERELMEFVIQNERYIDFALDNASTNRPGCLGAIAIYAMKDFQQAMRFRNGVYGNGTNLVAGSPIQTLREYLKVQSLGGSYPIYDYNNTLRCINAFHVGRQCGSQDLSNNPADWEI
jgi:hypothetical protein